jgi:hypothetical protein
MFIKYMRLVTIAASLFCVVLLAVKGNTEAVGMYFVGALAALNGIRLLIRIRVQ